jgi:hypothetical protein
MGWIAIIAMLVCVSAAALWARYNPDRHYTRPPTYRPERRRRRHPAGSGPQGI